MFQKVVQFPYSVSTLDSASLEPLSEQALIQIVSSYKPLGYSDLRLMKLPYLLYKRMSHGIFFKKHVFEVRLPDIVSDKQ